MAGRVRTRHSSDTKLADYLGSGRALLATELPTLRCVLRQGLNFREERVLQESSHPTKTMTTTYPVNELSIEMAKAVMAQWQRANVGFQPPVVIAQDGLVKKIKLAWETASNIAWKRITKKAQIKTFEDKLDKLVDITKCRCDIISCEDFGCPESCRRCKDCGRCGACKKCKECLECDQGAHISCSCVRDGKLPLLELRFIDLQRKKTGEIGQMMISSTIDCVEQKKQLKTLSRKEHETRTASDKQAKEHRDTLELEDRMEAWVAEESHQEEIVELCTVENVENDKVLSTSDFMKKRNTVEITGLASTAIRYDASSRMAGALATAYLGDLIRAGILPPEAASLSVDGAKVQRAKDKMMEMATERGQDKTEQDSIRCVMFDSRIDKKTRVRYFDEGTRKFYPRVEAEDHYTLTDGKGRYLHHLTKPGKEKLEDIEEEDEEEEISWQEDTVDVNQETEPDAAREEGTRDQLSSLQKNLELKPAEAVANLILDWMMEYGVHQTLTHLAGDSTNSNTGWKKGVIAWLERKIGRKMHWLVCQLHTNELMLRKLIEKLDGKTDSRTGFSGPLGKMLSKVKDMKPDYKFKKIDVGPGLIKLPEEIIKDLSTDQNLLYLRCQAAMSGHLPRDVALRKSGHIVHSRWVTTAETFIEFWQSEHGLQGELLKRLELVVTFIVSVYCPMWFNIKVNHSWLMGPRHILTELSLVKLQSQEVQDIVEATLRRSAWNSHSESVLQTMICSDKEDERKFAVATIIKIRGKNKLGNIKPRPRKLPVLNLEATSLKDMINWKGAKEPVLTCGITKEELVKFKEVPMVVPYYCLHTQGIERAIKEVTEASEAVYGFDRRDGFIRARAENRELMPVFSSKESLLKLLS